MTIRRIGARNSLHFVFICGHNLFVFFADLQLIEHDGHTPSAADLQLIRAERLPNRQLDSIADNAQKIRLFGRFHAPP
jgi:hypothetical protein